MKTISESVVAEVYPSLWTRRFALYSCWLSPLGCSLNTSRATRHWSIASSRLGTIRTSRNRFPLLFMGRSPYHLNKAHQHLGQLAQACHLSLAGDTFEKRLSPSLFL